MHPHSASREGPFGAEIREVPDSQSTPGELWTVEAMPSRGEFSLAGPGGAQSAGGVAPLPGSPRGGSRRLRLRLLLPYKAGAGPLRGRSCVRPASSSAVQLRRAGKRAQRSAAAAGARERAERTMGKSGEPAGWRGGCGQGSRVWAPGPPSPPSSHCPAAGRCPRERGGRRQAGSESRLRCGIRGAGWGGVRDQAPGGFAPAVSGAARKPGWPLGHQERGKEGETEGGSPCLRARDCVREGFQALMGLALGVRPRRGFCFVSGAELDLEKASQLGQHLLLQHSSPQPALLRTALSILSFCPRPSSPERPFCAKLCARLSLAPPGYRLALPLYV